jgi:hypothetical protein
MDHDESERQRDAAGGADEFAHAALNACAGIRSIAVPRAYDVHPEFGYLCPAPRKETIAVQQADRG